MKGRLCGAWAVAEEAWPEIEEFMARVEAADPAALDVGAFVNERPAPHVDEAGVGHVYAQGPLLHKTTEVERVMGATDYEVLAAELRQTAARSPQGVVLHADSPGGMVNGIDKAAAGMAEAVFENRVVVHTDGDCCSAMYWVAAGADAVYATETARVGSIGAKLVWVNASGYREAMGVKVEEMTNEGAELKGGLDDPSPEQREHWQAGLDFLGERFQAFVADHREVDEEVYAAGAYYGEQAMELGLVDGIGSADEARRVLLG